MNDHLMPELIAPDLCCELCVDQMRELTLMGQTLVSPGRFDSYAQRVIAGALHERDFHVHTNQVIGDRVHHAVAEIALPLLPRSTVVAYDDGRMGSRFAALSGERRAAERRLHWANDLAESAKFERAGWRVVRVRAPGLELTSALDLMLPCSIEPGQDNSRLVRLIEVHIADVVDHDLVAA
ncbi:MAG: hypothetical protein ACRDV7_05615 [Acidimicrobiia bacterium]